MYSQRVIPQLDYRTMHDHLRQQNRFHLHWSYLSTTKSILILDAVSLRDVSTDTDFIYSGTGTNLTHVTASVEWGAVSMYRTRV